MLLILPIIALTFLYCIFYNINSFNNSWRLSIISSAVIWGLIVTAITETLSWFHFITFESFLSAWFVIDVVIIAFYYKLTSQNTRVVNLKQSKLSTVLLSGTGLIILSTGLIGIVAPPNNWDSMDYHMPRVLHWVQNYSVAHYPVSYTPQLYQNPWSEFVIMHFQLLSGGDYFANSVQWLSLVGCAIGVSLIAKQLGANLAGQMFASVATVTIPMGILQASSTQNDLVEAFWLVCLACYTLIIVERGKNTTWDTYLLFGCSLGLCILTKGTAYFYILPFLIWVTLSQLKYLRFSVWKPALFVASLTILINIHHYLRNYFVFNSFLGEPGGYVNEVLGVNVMISNILRNLALHIGTPIGLSNGISNRIIQILHNFLGVDVHDKRTTFYGKFFVPGGWSTIGFSGEENGAGNLLHLLLILACIVIFIFRNQLKLKFQQNTGSYILTVGATFCVFCYLVKWQPWNARLHLPFFVLITPFLGLVLSNLPKKQVVNSIAIILILAALPWVLFNRYRPVIDSSSIFTTPRIEQYFKNRPKLQQPYMQAVEYLNSQQCNKVGLMMGQDTWEYPLWMIMHEYPDSEFQIRHINVFNASSIKEDLSETTFKPCGVIYMYTKRSKLEKVEQIKFGNNTFVQGWDMAPVSVLMKK
jgi:4-amino-4-deoxy-L-arabinose transferase-like glycosyltransferase